MKRIIAVLVALGALVASASAVAKLPALSDEAKAKAAEATAKTGWTDKVGAFQLCKAMDRVAAAYLAQAKQAGKDVKPVPTPPCTDPGPFAYTAPAPTPPIEAAGAHSPPATAVAPPSSNVPAAAQNPAKKQ